MPRPLTKVTGDGRLYQRPPDIEQAIDALAELAPAALLERTRSSPRGSPGYVPSECLVYFIRDAWSRRDKVTMTDLMSVLFARCAVILENKIQDRDMPNAIDVRANVLGELSLLFVRDDPKLLDYYECRFNAAFKTFRINFVNKEFDAINLLAARVVEQDQDDGPVDEGVVERISHVLRGGTDQQRTSGPPDPEDAAFRKEALQALNALPEDERRAYVLVYGLGYKQESEDPNEITAATRCGVTGRTIRNRLDRAKAKLSRLKEDK